MSENVNGEHGLHEDGEARVRVTDKRRIDPDTFAVRESGAAGSGLTAEEQAASVVDFDMGEVEAKVAELTGDLQRVHAEYANYRRRVERDREVAREMAVGGLLTELLVVLDDLDRAREHGEFEGAFRTVGEALENTLTQAGLERYGVAGEPFDPMLHEALTSEEVDGIDEPTVTSVYQPGYRYADRVLRAARVAVAGT